MLRGWQHLRKLVTQAPLPVSGAMIASEPGSQILTGYANALYNLGRRYESGVGISSNLREAWRCYSKAARLGNFWAFARLHDHP